MSLETQRKAREQYAAKQGYKITGCFGGTYESAKTDERKQFNAMLSFVRKSKEEMSAIIVYSVDRFSRSGANAIYITEQLKSKEWLYARLPNPLMLQRQAARSNKISSSFSRSTTTSYAGRNAWPG